MAKLIKFVQTGMLSILIALNAQATANVDHASLMQQYHTDWNTTVPGEDYIENELVVVFKAEQFSIKAYNTQLSEADYYAIKDELIHLGESLSQQYGFTLRDVLPAGYAALFTLPVSTTVLAAMEQVGQDQRIESAEPNVIYRLFETTPLNDPCFLNSDRICTGDQEWYHNAIGMRRAMDTLPIDGPVEIAVLDTGYRFDHPDASPHISANKDVDFLPMKIKTNCRGDLFSHNWDEDLLDVDFDATDPMQLKSYKDPQTGDRCVALTGHVQGSHGTKVADVIAAAWDNGHGGSGVVGRTDTLDPFSPIVVIPLRVMGSDGSADDFAVSRALYYASGLPVRNGLGGIVQIMPVDIVNMSFGNYTISTLSLMAHHFVWSAGVLEVAAAGNDSVNTPAFPASLSWVVAVSGIDNNFQSYANTNYGSWIDIAAPAVEIFTSTYDYSSCSLNQANLIGVLSWGQSCDTNLGGVADYDYSSGTSMATPIVSGIAAVYKAHHRMLSGSGLRQMLIDNAADLGLPGKDDYFGYGMVQFKPGIGTALVTNRGPIEVYLIDAASGEKQATIPTPQLTGEYNYTFNKVAAGDYYIYACTDEDADGEYCETGEAVATLVGAGSSHTQTPNVYQLLTAGVIAGNFDRAALTWPGKDPEPDNDAPPSAGGIPGILIPSIYAETFYDDVADHDYFQFTIFEEGDYRLWAEGRNRLECEKITDDLNVRLVLLDANENWLASDAGYQGPCSAIDYHFVPGTYYLHTFSRESDAPVGVSAIIHLERH